MVNGTEWPYCRCLAVTLSPSGVTQHSLIAFHPCRYSGDTASLVILLPQWGQALRNQFIPVGDLSWWDKSCQNQALPLPSFFTLSLKHLSNLKKIERKADETKGRQITCSFHSMKMSLNAKFLDTQYCKCKDGGAAIYAV